jgi:hypothetical protein
MVRAAASGAINYTGADPRNRQWRIRHRLLLAEVERKEDYSLLCAAHQHWLALLSHGNLTEESFADVKQHTRQLLDGIKKTVFPWVEEAVTEKKAENDILDGSTQALIERFKQMQNQQS